MNIKSPEEVKAILQILPDMYKSNFGKDVDLRAVKEHLLNVLEEKEHEMIERQFLGWNIPSIFNMLNAIDSQLNPPIEPETSPDQPKPSKKRKSK